MKIAGLVAAAGNSTRMGQPKALLKIGATTFVEHLVQTFLDAGLYTVVVTAPNCFEGMDLGLRWKDPNIMVCHNEFSHLELSGSIMTAIQKIQSDALIITPVDAPFCDIKLVHQMGETLATHATRPTLTVPMVDGKMGHPVGISHHFYRHIAEFANRGGVKQILKQFSDAVVPIAWSDQRVLLNINTWENYLATNPSAKISDAAATDAPGAKS